MVRVLFAVCVALILSATTVKVVDGYTPGQLPLSGNHSCNSGAPLTGHAVLDGGRHFRLAAGNWSVGVVNQLRVFTLHLRPFSYPADGMHRAVISVKDPGAGPEVNVLLNSTGGLALSNATHQVSSIGRVPLHRWSAMTLGMMDDGDVILLFGSGNTVFTFGSAVAVGGEVCFGDACDPMTDVEPFIGLLDEIRIYARNTSLNTASFIHSAAQVYRHSVNTIVRYDLGMLTRAQANNVGDLHRWDIDDANGDVLGLTTSMVHWWDFYPTRADDTIRVRSVVGPAAATNASAFLQPFGVNVSDSMFAIRGGLCERTFCHQGTRGGYGLSFNRRYRELHDRLSVDVNRYDNRPGAAMDWAGNMINALNGRRGGMLRIGTPAPNSRPGVTKNAYKPLRRPAVMSTWVRPDDDTHIANEELRTVMALIESCFSDGMAAAVGVEVGTNQNHHVYIAGRDGVIMWTGVYLTPIYAWHHLVVLHNPDTYPYDSDPNHNTTTMLLNGEVVWMGRVFLDRTCAVPPHHPPYGHPLFNRAALPIMGTAGFTVAGLLDFDATYAVPDSAGLVRNSTDFPPYTISGVEADNALSVHETGSAWNFVSLHMIRLFPGSFDDVVCGISITGALPSQAELASIYREGRFPFTFRDLWSVVYHPLGGGMWGPPSALIAGESVVPTALVSYAQYIGSIKTLFEVDGACLPQHDRCTDTSFHPTPMDERVHPCYYNRDTLLSVNHKLVSDGDLRNDVSQFAGTPLVDSGSVTSDEAFWANNVSNSDISTCTGGGSGVDNVTCDCTHITTGFRCELLTEPCYLNPCYNGGTCQESSRVQRLFKDRVLNTVNPNLDTFPHHFDFEAPGSLPYICECPRGWGGLRCGVSSVALDMPADGASIRLGPAEGLVGFNQTTTPADLTLVNAVGMADDHGILRFDGPVHVTGDVTFDQRAYVRFFPSDSTPIENVLEYLLGSLLKLEDALAPSP